MVVVSVSETYDLSTKVNKMSLLAIKTPSRNLIAKSYPGLAVNHRFFKLLKCDVKLACASVLPADPLQVGTTAGQIAPQDMFNPILYKAITTEGLSTLEYRLLGLGQGTYGNNDHNIEGESVISNDSNVTGGQNEFNAYYGLLSNHDGFRIAHPQSGLEMKGLIPLVHEKLYQYGSTELNRSTGTDPDTQPAICGSESGTSLRVDDLINWSMKGRSFPMPRINCTRLAVESQTDFGIKNNDIVNWQYAMPDIPSCYVGCIVMPPSKLNILYFRLVVRWYIEFSDPRPISEIVSFQGLATIGSNFYVTDYTFAKKDSEDDVALDLVETRDATIEKVMEGK